MKNLKINKIITKKYGTIGAYLKKKKRSRASMDSFQKKKLVHFPTIKEFMKIGGKDEVVKKFDKEWDDLIKEINIESKKFDKRG